jgi:hypothetical protein
MHGGCEWDGKVDLISANYVANTLTVLINTLIFKGSFIGDGSGLTSLNFNDLHSQTNLGTSGSYTPVIGDGTQNFNGVTQTGYYIKEGNLVHVEIWLTWNGKGTAQAGSTLEISLPFAVGPTRRAIFTVGWVNGLTFSHQLVAGMNTGQSIVQLFDLNSGTGPTTLTVGSCASIGEIQPSGYYRWHRQTPLD